MDPRFNDIFSSPENEIFKVVFFPDRIYHARYLNATRSRRYRYNVQEVRGKLDHHRAEGRGLPRRPVPQPLPPDRIPGRPARRSRTRAGAVRARRVAGAGSALHVDGQPPPEAMVKLHYDRWIDAYQAEIWQTLEAPAGRHHDFQLLDMMGRTGQITRVADFEQALACPKDIKRGRARVPRERRDLPFGYPIAPTQRNGTTTSSAHTRSRGPASRARRRTRCTTRTTS